MWRNRRPVASARMPCPTARAFVRVAACRSTGPCAPPALPPRHPQSGPGQGAVDAPVTSTQPADMAHVASGHDARPPRTGLAWHGCMPMETREPHARDPGVRRRRPAGMAGVARPMRAPWPGLASTRPDRIAQVAAGSRAPCPGTPRTLIRTRLRVRPWPAPLAHALPADAHFPCPVAHSASIAYSPPRSAHGWSVFLEDAS